MISITRRILLLLLVVLPLGAAVRVQDSNRTGPSVHVDEAASRLEAVQDDLELRLMVVNGVSSKVPVTVDIAFLTPENTVVRETSRDTVLKPRTNAIAFRVDGLLRDLSRTNGEELPWLRVRYRIRPQQPKQTAESESSVLAWGVLTLSHSPEKTFSLRVSKPNDLTDGNRLSVPVFVQSGGSGGGIGDVPVSGTLTIFSHKVGVEERVYTARKRTDSRGSAVLEFPLPETTEFDDITLTVEARYRNETRKRENLDIDRGLSRARIHVTTDKPAYRPGETLQIRLLAFGAGGQPLSDGFFEVAVRTPGGWDRTVLVLSRHGEAHTDWKIPEDAASGRYTVEVQEWNTHNLGAADSAGRFVVAVDLWRPVDSASNSYLTKRYEDREYIAFVKDSGSGRSEERRFTLRVSTAPILVQVAGPLRLKRELPTLHVLTQYADGTPAPSSVELRDSFEEVAGDGPQPRRDPIARIQTDEFGFGTIDLKTMSPPSLGVLGTVYLTADDGKGNRGWDFAGAYADFASVVVETDKLLYAAGDSLRILLRSLHQTGPVIVDLLRRPELQGLPLERLDTRVVHLENGAAKLEFAYAERFHGELVILAHHVAEEDSDGGDGRAVVSFPGPPPLDLRITPDKSAYRPGDEVRVAVRASSPAGGPYLVGFAVRAASADELTSTAAAREIGSGPANAFAGFDSIQMELQSIDRTRPVPERLRTPLAFFMSERVYRYAWLYDGVRELAAERSIARPNVSLRDLIQSQFEPIRTLLMGRPVPENAKAQQDLLVEAGVDRLRDPWGLPYRTVFGWSAVGAYLSSSSAGPDRREGTGDDLPAFSWDWRTPWPFARILDRAVEDYRKRTGSSIRSMAALRDAVRELGEDIDSWRDDRGRPIRFAFGVKRKQLTIVAVSTARGWGHPGAFGKSASDYTEDLSPRIEQAIGSRGSGSEGLSVTQVEDALREALPGAERSDPWGNPYYAAVVDGLRPTGSCSQACLAVNGAPAGNTPGALAERSSAVQIVDLPYSVYLEWGAVPEIPASAQFQRIAIRSRGPDGVQNTEDDFDIEIIHRLISSSGSGPDLQPSLENAAGPGTVRGIVRSIEGPFATAQIKLVDSHGEGRTVYSDADGAYAFSGVSPGIYRLVIDARGQVFRTAIRDIGMSAGATVAMDIPVVVPPAFPGVIDFFYYGGDIDGLLALSARFADPLGYPMGIGTPLRRSNTGPASALPSSADSHWTLVWEPAVETDRNGHAEFRFKLPADPGSWTVEVIASTRDGKVAHAATVVVAGSKAP